MRKEITDFKYGTITKIEEQTIPPGSSSYSMNFQTKGDHIELRRGSKILGTIVDNDQNPVRGLKVVRKSGGEEMIFVKRGRKFLYYDEDTEDFIEVGTDMFPAAAENDECSIIEYQSLAGDAIFVSSTNSSIYKIMLANPSNFADMATTDYKGLMFASQNRSFLIQRTNATGGRDKTGVYLSFIDAGNYTTVSNENVGTGNGVLTTFTDTLVFKAGGSKRTCFGVSVTDGTETFADDFDGNLVGNLGGTGTINYMTGAISVTFNTAPANLQAILATYQWEDSTDGGIADFSFSAPRLAGEGDVFRQDDGGGIIQAIDTYQSVEYCFHELKTWALELSDDDTNAVNLPYRKQVGIPNWKAREATGDGIYYVDVTNENDPKLRLLTLENGSDRVIPRPISDKLDLSGYRFDRSWVKRWGDLVLFGCRTADSVVNNIVIVYDTNWKSFDFVDYFADFADVYNGTLIIGDSLSPNVLQAFSGYDDEGSIVSGQFDTSLWDLEDPNRLKKVHKLQVEGLIQPNQIIGVYAVNDRNDESFLGYIRGDGDYVDRGQSVLIGSETIGSSEIGGGSNQTAFHYYRELKFRVGKFLQSKIRFKVETDEDGNEGIGYFSVSTIAYDDIRMKSEKIPLKYRIQR